MEAGLILTGPEVKSVRNGQVSLNGAFVTIHKGEAFIRNMFIAKYKNSSNQEGYNENGERKILLNKAEIDKLSHELHTKGTAIVPLEIYTRKRLIKLKIAVGKGKKQFDKRDAIKKKENKRSVDRAIRNKI